MAKKSKIAKDARRRETVARYAQQRARLKVVVSSPTATQAEREAAGLLLQKLPRDASPTRLRNRDVVDGRPRGFFRKFGLSRLRLREAAHRGELPGVSKSSW
ncbi:30S ribosomal protein S14 [Kutzneria kofuensis]|jgi:small subunit ribosomal protein S14|uniref:Small ribosomal subunit protein uS14 n=1 Tax=Kutzneria kofuensis TaxID=103725 RepID=A0A7W9KHL9_9PSEU|nr:30S ribosomal protein S14 [Kutzneria kofuensis]MBB5891994.1 small subunit ribosomal protein S14 [Kutzneria kofuensis]